VSAVGVDIGGSGIRAGVLKHDGTVADLQRSALSERSVGAVVDAVVAAVAPWRAERIGVGVPGFVRDGVVLASPNFPAWRDVPLQATLSERLGRQVSLLNDANAATLGAWHRLGRPSDLVLLTLGTGVGGGVVAAGRPLIGKTGTGAELGHTFVGGDAPCGCGGSGCLETWCSTNGLIRLAATAGVTATSGAEVLDAARMGTPWAVDVVSQAANHLGVALATLVNIFEPHTVALAGGLSTSPDLLGPAEDVMRARAIAACVADVRLVWMGAADDLAILGAATWARG